jgi:hypothetical protein
LLGIRTICDRGLGLVGRPRGRRNDSKRRPGARWSRLGVTLWEKTDLSREVAALGGGSGNGTELANAETKTRKAYIAVAWYRMSGEKIHKTTRKKERKSKRALGVSVGGSSRPCSTGPTTLMRTGWAREAYDEREVNTSTPHAPGKPQESHEDELRWKRETRGKARGIHQANKSMGATHLPPAITKKFILLDDLYALARTKRNFVFVLWGEVVASIDVFCHGKVVCNIMCDYNGRMRVWKSPASLDRGQG